MNNEDLINKLYNIIIKNSKGEEQILLLKQAKIIKSNLTKENKIKYNIDMDNNTFKIMFDDLNEEAKNELLRFYEIDSPEELNLDLFPITEIIKDYE